jgi:phosphatidylglycerol:prolipoprotein diacylglycerol transferase
MTDPFVWSVDPVLFRVGSVTVRYYGICFGLALVTGFLVWYVRVRRFGESKAFSEQMLLWGVPGVIIGGRLGHCIFYAPAYYLEHPLRVLAIWDGGTASHGVGAGLAVALWAFSRRNAITWTHLSDYFAPAVALAVGWVRVGNFFNSEVLGHPTSVSWAVVFARRDDLPRHPVQLYEILIGLVTWLVLTAIEKRNARPIGSGLIAGAFLTVYFGLRIFVEQYKEFYTGELRELAPFNAFEQLLGVQIHTGQWLSVLPVVGGLYLMARARRLSVTPRAV